jgi:transcriptional regulator with XRE-family HTH domain
MARCFLLIWRCAPSLYGVKRQVKRDVLSADLDWQKRIDRKALGGRLKAGRLKVGLGQRAIAALFGVDETTVSHWERGRDTPELAKLETLAWIYGESLHFIVTGDARPRAAGREVLEDVRALPTVRPTRAAAKRGTKALKPPAPNQTDAEVVDDQSA